MQQLAKGIASFGRGGDTELIHMTKGEIRGLQQLALAHGGSLTINPQTGLAEAGFLSSLLSIGGGIVGGIFGGPMGAAAGSSLGSLVGGDDPKTALRHGLMSGIGGAMFGGAADAAGGGMAEVATGTPSWMAPEVAQGIAPEAVNNTTMSGLDNAVVTPAVDNSITTAYGEGYSPIGKPQYDLGYGRPNTDNAISPDFSGSTNDIVTPQTPATAQLPATGKPLQAAVTPAGTAAAKAADPELLKDPMAWIKANPIKSGLGAYAAYSLLNSKPGTVASQAGPGGNIDKYAYHPAQYGPDGRVIQQASYGAPTVTHYAAKGGPIYEEAPTDDEMYSDKDKPDSYYAWLKSKKERFDIGGSVTAGSAPVTNGGQSRWYDLLTGGISGGSGSLGGFDQLLSANPALSAQLKGSNKYSYNPADQSYSGGQSAGADFAAPAQYSYDPSGQNFTKKMAQGGIASLPNEYAAGGKLLQGPGDGMSDSIPAVIKGPRPQRAALAQGEFVIPADVVSHLGNGSTDAGSKRLYAMMDKIRHARTGNKKQGKQIDPNHFLPA